jgi:hypothetical protein
MFGASAYYCNTPGKHQCALLYPAPSKALDNKHSWFFGSNQRTIKKPRFLSNWKSVFLIFVSFDLASLEVSRAKRSTLNYGFGLGFRKQECFSSFWQSGLVNLLLAPLP